jgi:hypothetical protein
LTNFTLTEAHLDRARLMGRNHAFVERELGVTAPSPAPLDEDDIRQVAWEITTVKFDPDADEAIMLATAYEDAYYDAWEDD